MKRALATAARAFGLIAVMGLGVVATGPAASADPGSPLSAVDPATLLAKIGQSVVHLDAYDEEGKPLPSGSGVVIGPNEVLTDEWVVGGAAEVTVSVPNSDSKGSAVALLTYGADELAVVVTDTKLPQSVVPSGAPALQANQPVFGVANVSGAGDTVLPGMFTGTAPAVERNDLEITSNLEQVDAGGGLFDANGGLVGILLAPRPLASSALAAPLAHLATFADELGTIKAIQPTFRDVLLGSAEAQDLALLKSEGVLNGYPDGTFRPFNAVTRAEMAAIMDNLLGYQSEVQAAAAAPPTFKDATAIPNWAWGYVGVAAAHGLLTGDPDGSFRPNDPVTKAEALALFVRALGDAWYVRGDNWPDNYVQAAKELNIIPDQPLTATDSATRGWIAVTAGNVADGLADYTYADKTTGKPTLSIGDGIYGMNAAQGRFPALVIGPVTALTAASITLQVGADQTAETYVLPSGIANYCGFSPLTENRYVLAVINDQKTVTAICQ